MPYLIDGNNVMAQSAGWHRDKPGARRALLDKLARFAQAKRIKVSVVFDGAPEQHFADGSSYQGVKVFYAMRGSDADERIKQMVEATRERRTLLVVTSDRALGSYIRSCGAQVIRSGEFRQTMEECVMKVPPPQAEEVEAMPREAVPEWMRYFGIEEEDEE